MVEYINKLLSISGDSLGQGQPDLADDLSKFAGKRRQEIEELLSRKNGFFAFESALRVFPSSSSSLSMGMEEWNSEELWRKDYSGLAEGCLFFAEDLFGGQFCIKNDVVCSFDPETGALEEVAPDLEKWVKELLNEYDFWTGYSLANEWQENNGILRNECRLMPKTPFVCGGQFALDNLAAVSAVSGMRSRANLARQIADMPEGTRIEFKIID